MILTLHVFLVSQSNDKCPRASKCISFVQNWNVKEHTWYLTGEKMATEITNKKSGTMVNGAHCTAYIAQHETQAEWERWRKRIQTEI